MFARTRDWWEFRIAVRRARVAPRRGRRKLSVGARGRRPAGGATRSTGSTSLRGDGVSNRAGSSCQRRWGRPGGRASGATSWTSTGWSASRRSCCRSTTRSSAPARTPRPDALPGRRRHLVAARRRRRRAGRARLRGRRRLVLEVTDAFCPWNEGAAPVDGARQKRMTRSPISARDVTALASVYLGGFTFSQLARAGRVEEVPARGRCPRGCAFPPERAPWCPEIF